MYSLSIAQKLHRKGNTKNALERWGVHLYTHSDLHCLGNIKNQPNKFTQIITRQTGH